MNPQSLPTSLWRRARCGPALLLALVSAAQAQIGDNILVNPGFETRGAGWSLPSFAAAATDRARSGAASLKWVSAGEYASARQMLHPSAALPLNAGDVIEAAGHLMGSLSGGRGAGFLLEAWDADNKPIPGAVSQVYVPNASLTMNWQARSVQLTVPEGAAAIVFHAYLQRDTSASPPTTPVGTVWFDDLEVRTASAVVGDYFPVIPRRTLGEPNILANPNFEEGAAFWPAETALSPGASISADETLARTGTRSLRIANSSASAASPAAVQPLSAAPGEMLQIRAWVKGASISAQGMVLRVASCDAAGAPVGTPVETSPLAGDFDWTELRQGYVVPPGAERVLLSFALRSDDAAGSTATGAVWIDDVEATRGDLDGNLAANVGFEAGGSSWTLPSAATVDGARAWSGGRALRLTNTDPALYPVAWQTILPSAPATFAAGDRVEVSGWVCGDAVGASGASLLLEARSAAGSYLSQVQVATRGGTFGWRYYSGEFVLPANTAQLRLNLLLRRVSGATSTGTVWFDDLRVRVVAPVNGGFESAAVPWTTPSSAPGFSMTRVTDQWLSGKASLRLSNIDSSGSALAYAYQTVDIPATMGATPGDRLEVGVWMKGAALTGSQGLSFMVIPLNSAGASLGGEAYADNLSGSFDWRLNRASLVVPAGMAKARVHVYFRKTGGTTSTGFGWIDDVDLRIRRNPGVSVFPVFPNYRGLVPPDDPAGWAASVKVEPRAGWPVTAPTVRQAVVSAQGVQIGPEHVTELPASASPSETLVLFDPAAPAAGDYHWRIRVTDPAGVTRTSMWPVRARSVPPSVRVDEEGFGVVGGQRFFPIGLYTDTASAADLNTMAAGGFNTVLSYAYGSGPNPTTFLNNAQSAGLKVVFSLKDMIEAPAEQSAATARALAAGRLVALRDHPALLSWYVNDEKPPHWIGGIQELSDLARALDPGRPTMQVMGAPAGLDAYFPTSDIIGCDPYPVGRDANLLQTTGYTAATVAANRGAKPAWMVLQAFDYAALPASYANMHFPSRAELMNQAHQALIAGAKGVFFFAYHYLYFADAAKVRSTATFNARWPDMTAVAAELQTLAPVILNGEKLPVVATPAGAYSFPVAAWEHGGKLRVLAANPYAFATQATIPLPPGWRIAAGQGVQGSLTGSKSGGILTLSAPALASGVFVLEPEPGFAFWREQLFAAGQLEAGVGEPLADPDEDGLANLLEYGFGSDPLSAGPAGGVFGAGTVLPGGGVFGSAGRPVVALDAEGKPTLVFARLSPAWASDVDYAVEFSSDLICWRTDEGPGVVLAETARHQLVAWPFPAEEGDRCFARVRVTLRPIL